VGRSLSPSPRGTARHQKRTADWRRLAGPLLLITASGAAAILFLLCCAQKSELELQVRHTQFRVEELRAERQAVGSAIGRLRDPAQLRRVAQEAGMTFTPVAVDRIVITDDLPPKEWAISPVTGLPPEAIASSTTPAGSLAHVPSEDRGPGL